MELLGSRWTGDFPSSPEVDEAERGVIVTAVAAPHCYTVSHELEAAHLLRACLAWRTAEQPGRTECAQALTSILPVPQWSPNRLGRAAREKDFPPKQPGTYSDVESSIIGMAYLATFSAGLIESSRSSACDCSGVTYPDLLQASVKRYLLVGTFYNNLSVINILHLLVD